jgi:hypothetical protein
MAFPPDRRRPGATSFGRLVADNRMLERNEDADAARRRVDRPGERDDQQEGKSWTTA